MPRLEDRERIPKIAAQVIVELPHHGDTKELLLGRVPGGRPVTMT